MSSAPGSSERGTNPAPVVEVLVLIRSLRFDPATRRVSFAISFSGTGRTRQRRTPVRAALPGSSRLQDTSVRPLPVGLFGLIDPVLVGVVHALDLPVAELLLGVRPGNVEFRDTVD